MARTYSLANLALNDTTDADWALAYVRFALRDTPNDASAYPEGSLQDEEINAALEAGKITDTVVSGGDGTAYYFPHDVAADLLRGNPYWLERWSAAGYSEERRKVSAVARGILKQGRWINASIITATDGRVGHYGLSVAL